MSPEAQRIAIAEACGWKNARGYWGIPPEGGRRFPYPEHHEEDWRLKPFHGLPDYIADLNAMHEAEKVLTYEQAEEFVEQLYLANQKNNLAENPPPWRFAVASATAAQRAEAFLRTIGRWETDEAKEAKP